MTVSIGDVCDAQASIGWLLEPTPLMYPVGCGGLGLKAESLNRSGSFKIRGVLNKLIAHPGTRVVVAYSSGNHGIAVAYAAKLLNVRATVVMPSTASETKLEAVKMHGAQLRLVGPGSIERQREAERLAKNTGALLVPPYNDEQVLAGAATVGLEISEQAPQLERVLVPVGGGGLLAGLSVVFRNNRRIKLVGVEPACANDAQHSLRLGSRVGLPAEQTSQTIADGLRTQELGELDFSYIQQRVDDVVTVTEQAIWTAMGRLALDAGLVAEPSGAVAAAAGWNDPQTGTVAVVTGRNVDADTMRATFELQCCLAA